MMTYALNEAKCQKRHILHCKQMRTDDVTLKNFICRDFFVTLLSEQILVPVMKAIDYIPSWYNTFDSKIWKATKMFYKGG